MYKEKIEDAIKNLVSSLIYCDLKKDADLGPGDIEEAIHKGEIKPEQIVEMFRRSLYNRLGLEKLMEVMTEKFKNKLSGVPKYVPMYMLHEDQAIKNHSQTLERLNQRGGLSVGEILDNLKRQKQTISFEDITQEHIDELNLIIRNHEKL